MEKIPSFQKNHDTLQVGLHMSAPQNGVTTFDLRFKKPNAGDFITPDALHSVEHMLATVLRNSREKEKRTKTFSPSSKNASPWRFLWKKFPGRSGRSAATSSRTILQARKKSSRRIFKFWRQYDRSR